MNWVNLIVGIIFCLMGLFLPISLFCPTCSTISFFDIFYYVDPVCLASYPLCFIYSQLIKLLLFIVGLIIILGDFIVRILK